MYDVRCNGNSPAEDQFHRILHDDASEMQFIWSFNWKIVTFRSFISYACVRVRHEYQMQCEYECDKNMRENSKICSDFSMQIALRKRRSN